MLRFAFRSRPLLRRSYTSAALGKTQDEVPLNLTDGDQLREKIVSLCKRRGFVFQNSEIYGGLSGSYDYGPLGSQLKKNIRDKWWNDFVERKPDCVGIETPILMHTDVWRASGHIEHFADPIVQCKICHMTFRENLIGDNFECPKNISTCTHENLGEKRDFNLLFSTHAGTTTDHTSQLFLRPETAQGIFINFANLCNTLRKTLPFGVGQVGRSFRNEISPREFLFRLREFEQMELEYFCHPDDASYWLAYWRQFCYDFCISIGLDAKSMRWVEHTDADKGLDRLFYAVLLSAYTEEIVANEVRVVLKLHEDISPFRCAVLPLSKKDELTAISSEVFQLLQGVMRTDYDVAGSIGKRYRRQDEIGTPYCLVVDFETLNDRAVTIRHRDTMQQVRVPIEGLAAKFNAHVQNFAKMTE